MPEEKKINRDIIYICQKLPNEDKKNNSEKSDTDDKKSNVRNILGTTASIAGNVLMGTLGYSIAGVAISALGRVIAPSDDDSLFNDYVKDGYKTKKDNFTDDSIQILPINYAEEYFYHDDIKLKGISNISIGMILAKHPFLKNTYVEIDNLEKEILHNKLSCLSLISQYLGAKSISGHAIIADEQKRIHDVSGGITYEVISGNLQGKKEEYQKYESKYSLDDTFSGEFTIESYEYAKKEAAEFGLAEDIEIRNLIEQRNPTHSTSISSRKVTIELSREYNKAIDAAFVLSVPGIKLNAGYKSILESRKTILFNMEIKF